MLRATTLTTTTIITTLTLPRTSRGTMLSSAKKSAKCVSLTTQPTWPWSRRSSAWKSIVNPPTRQAMFETSQNRVSRMCRMGSSWTRMTSCSRRRWTCRSSCRSRPSKLVLMATAASNSCQTTPSSTSSRSKARQQPRCRDSKIQWVTEHMEIERRINVYRKAQGPRSQIQRIR